MRSSSSSAYGVGPAVPRAASAATCGSSSSRASSRAVGLASCGSATAPSPVPRGCTRSTASAATNEPEPGRVSIDAVELQGGDRLAHRRAADLQALRQVALGRQPLAGPQQPHADLAGDPVGDPLVDAAWACRGPRLVWSTELHRRGLVCHAGPGTVAAVSSTFHAVDPSTGEPGAAFEEATRADVHAAVTAAHEAFRAGELRDPGPRAPRSCAAPPRRLRAAGDEIVAVAERRDRPARGAPARRARADRRPARGVRRRRRRRRLRRRDHRHRRPRRQADPAARRAAHARADRPGRRVRRQQLPARLLDRGRRHGQRAGRRLPGDRQGPPVAPGHERASWRASSPPRPRRAGLPGATFALLQASGIEVGEALVDEPAIAAVGFTGSFAGGKALHDRAAARERPIPVFAEMGSVNPIVVTEAALTERARGDRRGPGRVGGLVRRAAVHQAGRRLRARRRGGRRLRRRPRGAPGRLRSAGAAQRAPARRADRSRGRARRAGRGRRRRRRGGRAGLPLPPRRLPRRRRPRCASTPSCSRSASARSCCC